MLVGSAVTVKVPVSPEARVKVSGATVTANPAPVVTTAFQVSVVEVTLVIVFFQLQVKMQLPLAKEGLANVAPALLTRAKSTRPAPMLNGSAGVTPSGFLSV